MLVKEKPIRDYIFLNIFVLFNLLLSIEIILRYCWHCIQNIIIIYVRETCEFFFSSYIMLFAIEEELFLRLL
jgi:hypothetical protein